MVNSPTRAQPPLDFIPPALDVKVLTLARWVAPRWMGWRERITQVEAVHVERLVELYQDFQQGRARFLIAFRHPSPADSFALARLLWDQVPHTAKRMGVRLVEPVHSHFIYDRGIPLWAGQGVGWLYSRLGGTPIQRGKVDRQGLRSARDLFANGQFPLAAAPEGGNNGHSEIVSPLEPGIAQLGFWCVEDMLKAQRTEQVFLLPVGIAYRYLTPPWEAVEHLLTTLEQESGVSGATSAQQGAVAKRQRSHSVALEPMQQLYPRLYRLGEHLLALMEAYYRDFYGYSFEGQPKAAPELPEAQAMLTARLQTLLNAALQVAESYFQLTARGTVIERCRRIEQAGWDRIYRGELAAGQSLSAVELGLADRIAEEACLRMWHMRLVENFVAVTGNYVREKATVERFAETLLLLRDTIFMIEGKNPFPRPRLADQKVLLTVGTPLLVSNRWPAYQTSRRQAVSQLTQELQIALQSLIPAS
ncbi:1-acyl-sn-glycerol-3-phosphate acyltransferase [Pseudanabaena sp. FACHB-2040]|uniref:1-acyl-sn-glycerol-3-phosphate acyltransferase n=1 Tax=Pseudanabaena sp. FACHB-2040 TaxID=2692859 RepID=UPI0016841076|nr:1-acyl-sn-glycerol-3-phosphate acyltransferase [Pseudanabaena sp. FACHB-2040]MBD2259957.1 1-acyl-sn-glycerol-3-phosphate acyltransferase [Pseudanabaena sp. FACHB-2040]